MDKLFWISLTKVSGLGNRTIAKLFSLNPLMGPNDLKDPLWRSQICKVVVNNSILQKLDDADYMQRLIHDAKLILDNHSRNGIEMITIADDQYPDTLRKIPDPPVVLYCRGNLKALGVDKKVAVIGTRHPTTKGIQVAERVAYKLAQRGFAIVSGLALGIDTAGHVGALQSNGITIAVLAGGLDKVYPSENRQLADKIISMGGLLLSENPIGHKTQRGDFVKRDRIQSGLSLGVCTVQTDVDGGSMHTVKYAKNQGRVLFCPKILEDENLPVYSGIKRIIDEFGAMVINGSGDYEEIEREMVDVLIHRINNSYNTGIIAKKPLTSIDTVEQLSFMDVIVDKPHFTDSLDAGTSSEVEHLISECVRQAKLHSYDKDKLLRKVEEIWDRNQVKQ